MSTMLMRASLIAMCALLGCAGSAGTTDPESETGAETGGDPSSETGDDTGGETGAETGGDPSSETGSETCAGVSCDDGNPCTAAGWVEGRCVQSPRTNAPCDDGDACTQDDFCNSGGLCAGGAPVLCDDGNPCTDTPCDEFLGCQTFQAAPGSPCDDGDPCTSGDACGDAGCVGGPLDCPPAAGACEQAAGCNPATGECVYEIASDGAPCDDGDACTTLDECTAGVCGGTALIECMFLVSPNPDTCEEGVLGEEVKQRALEHLNELRAIHGIPPVVYDHGGDLQTQKSAFMMSVNSDISHYPSESWACYSWEGAEGCSSSNLFMRWGYDSGNAASPEQDIDGWLNDEGVVSLGHRRWLIDPFLQKISYGSAYGPPLVSAPYPWAQGSAMQVIHDVQNDPGAMVNDFVAFPQGEYHAEAFELGWYLSFGAVISKASKWDNAAVSYADAGVVVKNPAGASLPVHSVSWNTENYGLPNMIQWRVDGLQHGVTYTVEITNVETAIGWKSYTYTFRVNPSSQ